MMGPSHALAAALAGASAATIADAPLHVVILTAVGAVATGRGEASPDGDQALGLPHRGITHWPGWALIGWLLLPQVDPSARWLAVALLAGWSSHLLADYLFGGLPLNPLGGRRYGLRLRTDGQLERRLVRPALAVTLAAVLYLAATG